MSGQKTSPKENLRRLKSLLKKRVTYTTPKTEDEPAPSIEDNSIEADSSTLPFVETLRDFRSALSGNCISLKDSGNLANGQSLLDAQSILLLSYMRCLLTYAQKVVEGKPLAESDPIFSRMCQLRLGFEKCQGVAQKLETRLRRALDIASHGDKEAQSLIQDTLKPNIGAFIAPGLEGTNEIVKSGDDTTDGVYKPPKLMAVEYDDKSEAQAEKMRKEIERQRSRVQRSDVVRSLRHELAELPEERGEEEDSRMAATMRKLREQQEAEESMYRRSSTNKQSRREMRQHLNRQRLPTSAGATLADLSSDVGRLHKDAMAREREDVAMRQGRRVQRGKRTASTPLEGLEAAVKGRTEIIAERQQASTKFRRRK